MSQTMTLELEATDVSGQRRVRINTVSEDASVAELLGDLVPRLRLPSDDSEGRPLNYQALLEREGRHLHAAERVTDVVQPDDVIVVQPNIEAG